MARLRDDAGAVAILVALSVSTFLLGFAALAVDFGQVYTRQGELQSVADAVALAGATELPDIPEARRKAIETLCAPANRLSGWPAGTCPADGSIPTWAKDSDQTNGQILFFGEPNALGEFAPPALTDDGDRALAIQIKLPPSKVTFGLARTFGADDLEVSKAATAKVGTPIGTGFLPFAVTPEDLSDPNRHHQFCVVDPAISGGPAPGGYPGPTGRFPLAITATPLQLDQPTTGQQLTIRPLLGPFTPLPRTNPMSVVVDGHRITSTDHTRDHATVTLDVDLAAGPHQVWLEAGNPRSFVSGLASFTVRGAVGGGGDDPCVRPDARGVLNIGRNNPALNFTDTLSSNVKNGIEPTPHRYNEFPTLIPGGTLALVLNLNCTGLRGLLGAVFQILASVLGGFRPDINCVNTRNRNFSDGLTRGLLDTSGASPGRLLKGCTSKTLTTHNVTIDGTDLQDVTDENLTEGFPIKDLVEGNNVARGAIKAEAFACPRLGVVPVINPGVNLLHLDGQYPIVDFAYVWIQDIRTDDTGGLVFENGGNRLRAVRFWVIDPGFFGRTVSGSPKVGPYLGPQFPREVLLVKNPGED